MLGVDNHRTHSQVSSYDRSVVKVSISKQEDVHVLCLLSPEESDAAS